MCRSLFESQQLASLKFKTWPLVFITNSPTERRPAPAPGAQLVSFTVPGAFTASEPDLLTLVVHKPGNPHGCSHTHTERKNILSADHIAFVRNDLFSFFILVEGRAADCEFLFDLAWIIILPNRLLTRF